HMFHWKGDEYSVHESSCSLNVIANNGDEYTLVRKIKSGQEFDFNEIEVIDDGKSTFWFLQSSRDHRENGFYSWLAKISNLDLISIDLNAQGQGKPLYMQNIFSASFVEQTKGWADYFSMIPPFGI